MAKYAGVIVDISLEKLDRVFDYKVPAHLEDFLHPGMPVWIPFWKGKSPDERVYRQSGRYMQL